jgi:hypothetical protein
MTTVAIIDVRPYTEGSGDAHDAVNSRVTRARLVAANGPSANQVLHTYEPGTDIQRVQRDNLDEMEQWLAAIANDTAAAKTSLEKVIRNRPATVTDACYTKEGEKITDMTRCARMFPVTQSAARVRNADGRNDAEVRVEDGGQEKTIRYRSRTSSSRQLKRRSRQVCAISRRRALHVVRRRLAQLRKQEQ